MVWGGHLDKVEGASREGPGGRDRDPPPSKLPRPGRGRSRGTCYAAIRRHTSPALPTPIPVQQSRGGPMKSCRRLLSALLLLPAVPAMAHDYEHDCQPMSAEARAEFERARMLSKLGCAGLHDYVEQQRWLMN